MDKFAGIRLEMFIYVVSSTPIVFCPPAICFETTAPLVTMLWPSAYMLDRTRTGPEGEALLRARLMAHKSVPRSSAINSRMGSWSVPPNTFLSRRRVRLRPRLGRCMAVAPLALPGIDPCYQAVHFPGGLHVSTLLHLQSQVDYTRKTYRCSSGPYVGPQ